MRITIRRWVCLLMAVCMLLTVPVSVSAATTLPDSIYLTQEGRYTCTLAAAAMMVRARFYLNGNDRWDEVTESSLRPIAWADGVGLRWDFTYKLGDDRVTVANEGVYGMSIAELKAVLDTHPEGIVLYCGDQPHAVFATDYEGDVFYCADPASAYSGERIPLEDSWIGYHYGSQSTILRNVTAYWYVSDHTGSDDPVPVCNCSEAYAGEYICDVEDYLNIRAGHGTEYEILGRIPAGATVTVTKANSTWAHVTYEGISGYVSMGFLRRNVTELEITKQPENVTAFLGDMASIHVEAKGDGLTYQWQYCTWGSKTWRDTTVSGNTTDTITMEATTGRNGCRYRCVITDVYGNSVTSEPAELTVEETETVCSCSAKYAGEYVCTAGDYMNIRAGHGTKYEVLGRIPAGALVVVTKASGDGDDDWAHVIYDGISGYASMEYLELRKTELKILEQPEDVATRVGDSVSFRVGAQGDGLQYQWQWKPAGSDIWQDATVSGSDTDAINLTVSGSENGNQYRCVITDTYGEVIISDAATLTVEKTELEIIKQPENVTAVLGDTASIHVEAKGDGLTYQWQYCVWGAHTWRDTTVSGNTTDTITMEATAGRNGCRYRCVITDAYGNSVTSEPAELTVEEPCDCTEDWAGEYVCMARDILNIRAGHGTEYDIVGIIPAGATVTVTKSDGDWAHVIYEGISGYVSMGYLQRWENKLKIVDQPTDAIGVVGQSVSFGVHAVGEGLTYQWQWNDGSGWKNSSNGTEASLSVVAASHRNGYLYRCVIMDVNGNSAVTEAVTLTVAENIRIDIQPKAQAKQLGETAVFTVKATGEGLTYQWQWNDGSGWKNSSNGTEASLSVVAASHRNGYQYRCVITDAYGNTLTTDVATLKVKQPEALAIIKQPEDQNTVIGGTAVFAVEAQGDGLTYQWQWSDGSGWKNSSNGNAAILSVVGASHRNGYQYRCKITDASGNVVYSEPATLTIGSSATLEITKQPENVTAALGSTVSFHVEATGEGLTYQWQWKAGNTSTWRDTTVSGNTTDTITLEATAARNGYQYRCVITDANGNKVYSDEAKLTVK